MFLWIAVAAFTVLLIVLAMNPAASRKALSLAGGGIGGPFELQRTDGTTYSDRDLAGVPHAMFFGFTHCPEVCPTTLWELTGWMKQLGGDADKLKVVFVTVDPERDTRETMAEYMTSFDPRIVALTGTMEQIETIKKAYKVYSRKVPLEDGDYTVDHTASVYLMHGDGSFSGTISFRENSDTALEKLRRLVDKG